MSVCIVDVDEPAGGDDVAHNSGLQTQPHLGLLRGAVREDVAVKHLPGTLTSVVGGGGQCHSVNRAGSNKQDRNKTDLQL